MPLCLPTAIEPQKEEADENYNSVNTRMRKTQVGLLFPELEHFSPCFIEVRGEGLGDHQVQPNDFPNGETEAQRKDSPNIKNSQFIITPCLFLHSMRSC